MARWKVVFDWKVRGKVSITFYAEVEVWAETEDEAVEKARSRLSEKLASLRPEVQDTYKLDPTLDVWIPGKWPLRRQLEVLQEKGVEVRPIDCQEP